MHVLVKNNKKKKHLQMLHSEFQKYVAETIKTFAKIIYTDTNDTHVDKLARVLALNMACKYELEDCENFVNKKLTEWLNEKKK